MREQSEYVCNVTCNQLLLLWLYMIHYLSCSSLINAPALLYQKDPKTTAFPD